ncbi:MAG: hypothetical protein OXI50_01575 [Gammaproteobacteria bacterium]|nr:hypothetical protein [Gammaproteobacteria bacterium]
MRLGAGLMLALLNLAAPVRAQSAAELTARCSDASGGAAWCAAGATAYQAAASGIGLAASAGSDIPGTSSTLGWRRGLGPRLALSARFTGARIPLPDLVEALALELPELRSTVSSASLEGAVGLFDGFRWAPQYGGFLSLDLVASVGVLGLPRAHGFEGDGYSAGVGARVGLLRESFDVPGISVSAVRRFPGDVRLGAARAITVRLEPVATSFRALIGKEFSAAGIVAGAGWDRYSGTVTIDGPDSDRQPRSVTLDGPAVDRLLLYMGVSRTWQVLVVAGEIGWAAGFDGLPDPSVQPFDPSAGSVFGSLSLRITR